MRAIFWRRIAPCSRDFLRSAPVRRSTRKDPSSGRRVSFVDAVSDSCDLKPQGGQGSWTREEKVYCHLDGAASSAASHVGISPNSYGSDYNTGPSIDVQAPTSPEEGSGGGKLGMVALWGTSQRQAFTRHHQAHCNELAAHLKEAS